MANISLFKFKDREVRTIEIKGEPWFVTGDACKILDFTPHPSGGYSRHTQRLDKSERMVHPTRDFVGMPGASVGLISESGLYKLIMRSNKPEAKDFQNWVTRVVLPAIRKDGGYIQGEEHVASGAMTEDELVFKAMEVMKRKVDRLSAENAKQEAIINEHLRFMTVGEYREHHHRYWEQSTVTKMSVTAKKFCVAHGLTWTKQSRLLPRNGKLIQTEVNVYPIGALDFAAATLGVFEDA
ncbi:BRO family protein [Sinorhizobium meliloti]|nr:BRO family protein [Sinorhizobium meliloti]